VLSPVSMVVEALPPATMARARSRTSLSLTDAFAGKVVTMNDERVARREQEEAEREEAAQVKGPEAYMRCASASDLSSPMRRASTRAPPLPVVDTLQGGVEAREAREAQRDSLEVAKAQSRHRLDFFVSTMAAAARRLIARKAFVHALKSQAIIAAHARGQFLRAGIRSKQKSATAIQSRFRGHQARTLTAERSEWRRAAKAVVVTLIKALEHGNANAVRKCMSDDVLVHLDVPDHGSHTQSPDPRPAPSVPTHGVPLRAGARLQAHAP
jgi:hypothetical protein